MSKCLSLTFEPLLSRIESKAREMREKRAEERKKEKPSKDNRFVPLSLKTSPAFFRKAFILDIWGCNRLLQVLIDF